MRLNLLSYASGLGVIAGALLWPTSSQAQGFCYMVNGNGAVVNLDSLCQGDSTPNLSEPQADSVGSGEVQKDPSSNVRSFTITGPASIPGTSQAPSVVAPITPQPTGANAGLGSTTPQPTSTPGVAPVTPQLTPPPGVVLTTPQPVPSPGVAPTGPQIVPSPGVAPTAPQIIPSSRVTPAAPQPTGTDARLAPAGSAVEVDGAGNNTGVATPAAGIGVPAIVVPDIPVPRIGTP